MVKFFALIFTSQVWDTQSGQELLTLEGHKNVVYAIAFNNPYGDKIITGSFDKTCKLWNAETGELYHTFRGHATEIVCLYFNPQVRGSFYFYFRITLETYCSFTVKGTTIATGSMDNTAKLWDVETGVETHSLMGHTGRALNLFVSVFQMHLFHYLNYSPIFRFATRFPAEIVSLNFNQTGQRIITGSFDHTVKVWDVRTGR
jgi:dynein assembly factor with WDR repeat domains 1